mmetsp:Transcript_43045/g.130022  ORF Transcript_43045/g.130022 Transcript_43045/m.130022 type:complete len:350 (+) Transcript_43045:3104-4153(+)
MAQSGDTTLRRAGEHGRDALPDFLHVHRRLGPEALHVLRAPEWQRGVHARDALDPVLRGRRAHEFDDHRILWHGFRADSVRRHVRVRHLEVSAVHRWRRVVHLVAKVRILPLHVLQVLPGAVLLLPDPGDAEFVPLLRARGVPPRRQPADLRHLRDVGVLRGGPGHPHPVANVLGEHHGRLPHSHAAVLPPPRSHGHEGRDLRGHRRDPGPGRGVPVLARDPRRCVRGDCHALLPTALLPLLHLPPQGALGGAGAPAEAPDRRQDQEEGVHRFGRPRGPRHVVRYGQVEGRHPARVPDAGHPDAAVVRRRGLHGNPLQGQGHGHSHVGLRRTVGEAVVQLGRIHRPHEL